MSANRNRVKNTVFHVSKHLFGECLRCKFFMYQQRALVTALHGTTFPDYKQPRPRRPLSNSNLKAFLSKKTPRMHSKRSFTFGPRGKYAQPTLLILVSFFGDRPVRFSNKAETVLVVWRLAFVPKIKQRCPAVLLWENQSCG